MRKLLLTCVLLAACMATFQSESSAPGTSAALADSPPTVRRGFLGAFFRPEGTIPFGVFSVYSKQTAPSPYPTPGRILFGKTGYCDRVAENGVSISSGYLVDRAKLANIVDLGVTWTRTAPAPFFDDGSHIFGPHSYAFADFDSAQCALARHGIRPMVGLEAGPVQYNLDPDSFSPHSAATYKSAQDFATWCTVVAKHEAAIFPEVHRYSIPGNEVNGNAQLFPGGDAQIARYTAACYHAIKSVSPKATVYGFELNMDRSAGPAAFVARMYALGCKPGTCYDGLSLHLSLRYPIPPPETPCFPDPGGTYSMRCISDVQSSAHARVHVIIGETVFTMPGSVRDEATKARAIVDEIKTFARDPYVDGVNYANVDECDLYPSGYFSGGCIVDSLQHRLPAFDSLRALAREAY
jgi:hypothetical protein